MSSARGARDSVPLGVAPGRDGWLFWVGLRGEVEALYADTPATRRLLGRWCRRVSGRAERLRRLGVDYVHTIVPEKIAIQSAEMASPLPGADDPPGVRLRRMLAGIPGVATVDLHGPLRAALADGPVYLRTDTHWNHRGYLAAYSALCDALGSVAAPNVLSGTLTEASFVFDLGGKCVPPIAEEYIAYDFERHARRVEANALVHLRESGQVAGRAGFFIGSRSVLRNPRAPDPRRIALFGDSYVFDQGPRLTAMLAETFYEVHAIWSANIDWAYVERIRPDILVYEIAERFLRRVPHDRFRADAFAERRVRGAAAGRLLRWLQRVRGV